MAELEIRWSIMARVRAAGLRVVDSTYKTLLGLTLMMGKLQFRFQESLSKELVQCENSPHLLGVRSKLLMDIPSWTSILARSKTEWVSTLQAKTIKLRSLEKDQMNTKSSLRKVFTEYHTMRSRRNNARLASLRSLVRCSAKVLKGWLSMLKGWASN